MLYSHRERFHRIDFRGAQCRDVARQQRDDRQQHRHRRKRESDPSPSLQTTNSRSNASAHTRPPTNHKSQHNEHRSLLDDHQQHVARLRAERQPDPDLIRALRHRVTHHAIQPNDSQHQAPLPAKIESSVVLNRGAATDADKYSSIDFTPNNGTSWSIAATSFVTAGNKTARLARSS